MNPISTGTYKIDQIIWNVKILKYQVLGSFDVFALFYDIQFRI